MNLRKLARGRECQVRIYGICNRDPETVSLAHLRLAGITGGSQKAPDLLGAWACSDCARATESGYTTCLEHKIAFYEGMARTQNILISEGVVKW